MNAATPDQRRELAEFFGRVMRRAVEVGANLTDQMDPAARAESLRAELRERIDGPDIEETILTRPLEEIIREIRRDLASSCAKATASASAAPPRTSPSSATSPPARPRRRPHPSPRCPASTASPAATRPPSPSRRPAPTPSAIKARACSNTSCASADHPARSALAQSVKRAKLPP